MVQNTLKQKARKFAKEYEVPYLTALRAVDEPLHELKNLIEGLTRPLVEGVTRPGQFSSRINFSLLGDQGIYSSAFDLTEYKEDYGHDYNRLIKDYNFSHFKPGVEAVMEIGRRHSVLKEASAKNIWHYRELVRAGLVVDEHNIADIKLHHVAGYLSQHENIVFWGADVGIFAVFTASFLNIKSHRATIPVTRQQLESLVTGSPVGELHHRRVWCTEKTTSSHEYGTIFGSYDEDSFELHPRLRVLYKTGVTPQRSDFEKMGLDMDDFFIENSSSVVLKTEREGDTVTIYRDDAEWFSGDCDRVIYM